MTYLQKFDVLIAEYEGYISSSPDPKTQQHYRECLTNIRELRKIALFCPESRINSGFCADGGIAQSSKHS